MDDLVLGVDQSLAHTGMVVVCLNEDPTFVSKHQFNSSTAVEGTEVALKRSVELYHEFDEFFGKLLTQTPINYVVHETPPTANRMQRPESSLLAAMALRLVAERYDLPVEAIHSNKAKLHFTGSSVAKKPVMRERLWKAHPEFRPHKLNEHQADALAIVIARFYPQLAASKKPAPVPVEEA